MLRALSRRRDVGGRQIGPTMTASQMRSIAHTRSTLLRAAARIVERGGGKSLTTLGAAHETHLAVGSVYRYFGDRNALLAAAVAAQRCEM